MADDTAWSAFAREAAKLMRLVLDDELSIEDASKYFDSTPAIHDPELRDYLANVLYEFGGSPTNCMDVLGMLEAGATQDDLLRFMNS